MYRAAFKYVPQPEATTFAFPSVFILLLCLGNTGYPVQGLNRCLLMQTLIVIVCIHKPPGYNIVNSVSGRTCRRGISPLPSLPRRGTAPRHLVPKVFLAEPSSCSHPVSWCGPPSAPGYRTRSHQTDSSCSHPESWLGKWATIRPSADPSSCSHPVSWLGKWAANRPSGDPSSCSHPVSWLGKWAANRPSAEPSSCSHPVSWLGKWATIRPSAGPSSCSHSVIWLGK